MKIKPLSILVLGMFCFNEGFAAERSAGQLSPPSERRQRCSDDSVCARFAVQGRALSREGKLYDASVAYRRAYERCADPFLLFQIGRVHHKMGQLAEALIWYKRYMEAGAEGSPAQLEQTRILVEQAARDTLAKRNADLPQKQGNFNQPALSPTLQQQSRPTPHHQPRRPVWRIVTGSLLLGGGLIAVGIGAWLFQIDGQCQSSPLPPHDEQDCTPIYVTKKFGIPLLSVGGAALVGGVATIAIPSTLSQDQVDQSRLLIRDMNVKLVLDF